MELHLERINEVSPYKVEWEEEAKEALLFFTDLGIEYRVVFVLDEYSVDNLTVYQFEFLTTEKKHIYDEKVHKVIRAIIEEFLSSNQKAILYAADSSDNRECCRQRLFARWFNRTQEASGDMYILKHIGSIAGMIIRKDNPQLEEYLTSVEEFCQTLQK